MPESRADVFLGYSFKPVVPRISGTNAAFLARQDCMS